MHNVSRHTTCRPKAGALAGERDSLLQQLELERTAAEDARKEVGARQRGWGMVNRMCLLLGLLPC